MIGYLTDKVNFVYFCDAKDPKHRGEVSVLISFVNDKHFHFYIDADDPLFYVLFSNSESYVDYFEIRDIKNDISVESMRLVTNAAVLNYIFYHTNHYLRRRSKR